MVPKYASVIFPLALPRPYTYSVPPTLAERIQRGTRVEVSLRNKLYTAIVYELHEEMSLDHKPKAIIDIMDEMPLVTETQLKFWQWVAEYYCCTLGEVLNVAMPSGLKLESETRIVFTGNSDELESILTDDEYLVAEAVHIRNELTINEIRDILNRKTVFPVIRSLIDKRIVTIKEELIEKFKPRTTNYMTLAPRYADDPELMSEAIGLVERSDKQTRAFLAFIQLAGNKTRSLPVSEVCKIASTDTSVIQAMVKKGLFIVEKKVQSRIFSAAEDANKDSSDMQPLSVQQLQAICGIRECFTQGKPVLIYGVTGSGKTRVYSELIGEQLKSGKQVLYLLPEIALTTHMVQRLKAVFGQEVLVYHSRMNSQERVELWNAVMHGGKIVIAARSGLFLPYHNLGLIIVDEEHDPSFKQNDPNPRYNARDAAVYMSHLTGASIILGSATPSLESYANACADKYGLVTMADRHGESVLPKITVVDIRQEYKDKRFDGLLSQEMLLAIRQALEAGEQVLLFQNRRGYAPTLHCKLCGWKAGCANCDVHLTIHKAFKELRCHYCGFRTRRPETCPACGSHELLETGFGTEKIEELIKETFPESKVGRLDLDTAKTKASFESILQDFEEKDIDILIGTQMITKGLDFDNISLVGILNADSILRYPDLRANERAFQLMTQVSGRAGRREKQGRVIIQTFDPSHPVITETMLHLYDRFYTRESSERKQYKYPPFYRMIAIEMLHKNAATVTHAAEVFAGNLRKHIGSRLIGPAVPGIERLRGQYIRTLTIKMEKDPVAVQKIKAILMEERDRLLTISACKAVRVNIDVDPY